MIHVNDKDFVVPGQILAEDDFYSGRGTYKDQKNVISSLTGRISLRNKKISVIPLKSKYVPKRGDVVIGEVSDVRFSLWELDLNSPYSGILPASEVFGREKKDLNRVFKVGDVLFLKVVDVDEVKKVKLGLKGRGMGKFRGGLLVDIAPTKVPRLIGKKGSMINMIKDKTQCKIVVGQNGLVWIRGDNEMEVITKNIIKLIEENAHTSGLTNRIRDELYLRVDGEIPPEFNEELEPEYNSQIEEINNLESNYSQDNQDNQDNFINENLESNTLVNDSNGEDSIADNNSNNNIIIAKETIVEEEIINNGPLYDEEGLENPQFQDFKSEVELEIQQETSTNGDDNEDNISKNKNDVDIINNRNNNINNNINKNTNENYNNEYLSTNNDSDKIASLNDLENLNKFTKKKNNEKNDGIPKIKPVTKKGSFFDNYKNIKKSSKD
ncbi:polyribonucleotide nucleotidyltransferase [Methanobrevibacter curvatus]|uniref:Exosome complex component Rrp4 n=1 Tax=Methanobrevibacter curvatus TaxID=49547 RepID=A0A165YYP0_9EURY|nr:polyribonucleotide nucleotidyltransferase [Methanobrevibacter curvatus]